MIGARQIRDVGETLGISPSAYSRVRAALSAEPRRWVVTGCAGFIGSHLVAELLGLGQEVVGIDDFSSGKRANLDAVRRLHPESFRRGFRLLEGDIREAALCREGCRGADYVSHQAAFVSVPRSITDPESCRDINVGGFRKVWEAACEGGVRRVVYASSSAVYGDGALVPAREDADVSPTTPYGASKLACELLAWEGWQRFEIPSAGLRYFNVFGPRQDPEGGFAAVIPRWLAATRKGEACLIHGDGAHTRDFCHVADVIQANLLAAVTPGDGSEVYNVGQGARTSLKELHGLLGDAWSELEGESGIPAPIHLPARPGDIRHSHADITKIRERLGFAPTVSLAEGLVGLLRADLGREVLPDGLPT